MQDHHSSSHSSHNQAGTLRRLAAALALTLSACCFGGCSVLLDLNDWMIENGVVRESLARRAARIGLDPEQVLEVRVGENAGVGVVVEDGMVLTADHVVGQATEVTLHRPSMVAGAVATRIRSTVLWRDTRRDLCLLQPVQALPSGRSRAPESGRAYVITLNARLAQYAGNVSRTARVHRVTISPDGRYRIDEPLVQGDSGSPVVQNGHVVGVISTADRFAPIRGTAAEWRRRRPDLTLIATVSR